MGIQFRSELHPDLDDPYSRRWKRNAIRLDREQAPQPQPRLTAPTPAVAPLEDAYAPRFEDTEARRRQATAEQYMTGLATANEQSRKTQLRALTNTRPVVDVDPGTGEERPVLNEQGRMVHTAPPVTPDPRVQQAADTDAYARRVAIPKRATDPKLAQRQVKTAEGMQTEEAKRAAGVMRGLKAQGVEMETRLDGSVHPKRDLEGRLVYKPGVISEFENRGGDNLVSVHRDRFGNEQDVPLRPKIDKETGEKYVVGADGVSRISLGVDEDFILRRDATEAGKIAGLARSELTAIKSQETELKTQIEDYGGQAALIAANKDPTDEDRARLKQIQIDRGNAVRQMDQLKEMRAAKSEEAQAATATYLDKRRLIVDKLKGKQPQREQAPAMAEVQQQQEQAAGLPSPPKTPEGVDMFQVFAQRPEMEKEFLGALTPEQRKDYAQWKAGVLEVRQLGPERAAENKAYREKGAFGKVGANLDAFVGSAAQSFAALATAPTRVYGLFFQDGPVKERGAVQWADAIDESFQENFMRGRRDSVAAKLGNVVGSGLSFLVPGGALMGGLRLLGVGAKVAKAATLGSSAIIGATLNGAGTIPESVNLKLSDEEVWKRFALGAGLGTTEAAGVGGLLNKMDRLFGGSLKKFFWNLGKEGIEEAGQEALQQSGQELFDKWNQIAKVRDPKTGEMRTKTFSEITGETAEAAMYGAIGGIFFGGIIGAAARPQDREALSEAAANETMNDLRKDVTTHIADLQGERAMLQTEIDDPATPAADKAAHITRVAAIDDEISAVSELQPQPGVTNEPASTTTEKPTAQRPDTSVSEPEPSGDADNRRVPDDATQAVQNKPGQTPSQESQPREGDAAEAERVARSEELLKSEPALARTAKAAGLEYGGVHDETHHTFTDTRTGTSVTVPRGTTPKQLLAQVTESRKRQADTSGITEILRDRDPMDATKLTDAAAVSMAQKLLGSPAELGKRHADSGNLSIENTARQILAEHKLASVPASETAAKGGVTRGQLMEARQVSEVNQEIIDKRRWPNGKKVTPEDIARLTAENEKHAATIARSTVDAAAQEAATSPSNDKPIPSMAQHEADNAPLGHDSIGGMQMSFENPAGSIRTNVDMARVREIMEESAARSENATVAGKLLEAHRSGDAKAVAFYAEKLRANNKDGISKGRPWASKMRAHYGRFKRTIGKDGDPLDAYVKQGTPKDWAGTVFVINQKKESGEFDEHKAMVGYDSQAEAVAEYGKHYDIPAAKLIDSVAAMPWEQFKTWAREGDLTKKATSDAVQKPEATPVLQREPQEAGEAGSGRGRVEPEQQGEEATGEQRRRRLRDQAEAPKATPVKGRANRLLNEAMLKGKIKAMLAALDIEIVRGTMAIEVGYRQHESGLISYKMALNPERIDELTATLSDEETRDYIETALSEEMIHFAQFEAARKTWDQKGKFQDHFTREYADVEAAMTNEERTAAREAYAMRDLQGSTLGAEFVRQLIQQQRTGTITEAVIRARTIVQRILDVLKNLLSNPAARSEALQRAYDLTSAVLDSIEAAGETRTDATAAKPQPQQAPTTPAQREVEASAATARPGPPATGAVSGASDALKQQARQAFEGLFAPEPRVERTYAPESETQTPLPKDRRAAFFDLADRMEAEGITTPEKVAAFLDEISGGKARKFSQALWDTMGASGAVARGDQNWNAIYSAIDAGQTQADAASLNEPDTRAGDRDAGQPASGEARANREDAAGGQIPRVAVPAEELAGGRRDTGPDARQPGGGQLRGDAGAVAQPGGSEVGGFVGDVQERTDSPATGARPDAGSARIEPPRESADRNHVIGPDDVVAPRGAVAKLKANVSAVKLLKRLEAEKRNPTPEEKQKLAQYTGWGQFKGAFDTIRAERRGSYSEDKSWNDRWGATYDQLKKILTPEEWNTAAESTLNAHFTAPEEIRAMWQIVSRLGFARGRVLEPAVGVGHFFGLMPPDMQALSQLHGIDMDSISSRIAKKLYPQADIKTGRFEKAKLPNNYFDLVISNVPFHEVGPADNRYPNLNLHNYFFARSFDLVKPGGFVVAISSNSTLDNNPGQRAYLQSKADLVAAIRLPNNAFLENAGTEVTTDILIFRKPDGTPFKGESFLNTVQLGSDGEKPIIANEYFQRHPEHALGIHSLKGTQYKADSYALVADKYRPIGPALQEAIGTLPRDLANHAANFYAEQDFGIAQEGEKEGSISFRDGAPLQIVGSEYKTPAWAREGFRSRMRDPKSRVAAAKSFVALRDKLKELLSAELTAGFDESGPLRGELRKLYDAHVGKFGNLEKGNLKFLEDDPEYYLVMGLEIVGKERRGDVFEKVITPADVLSKRVLYPSTPPTSAANVTDAAMISMQYRGTIDAGYVAQLTGMDEETAQAQLLETGTVFKNPKTGLLETRDAYLASNVRQKLREAEAAAADDPTYAKNVEELKAIQPERVSFENVRARAGSAWIPERIYTAFAQKVLGKSAKVTYSKPLDRWSVELGYRDASLAENRTTYGTERASGVDILTDILNLKNPTITDTVSDVGPDGKIVKRTVVNQAETDKARDKARRLKSEFDDYARSDPDARQAIEDTYNDTFNSYVVPRFDGSHLVFPGMAASYKGKTVSLRPHQKDVIYRITQTGGTMMAHGVGGGKTIAQIAAAMEMRRLGQARKPLIVVDKPTIGQFAATFRQIYPNANILVATQDSFSAANRKRFMSRIATGNWDAVIMSNSQFDLMPSDPEVVQSYVQTSIDQLREIAADAVLSEGKQSAKVRQIQTEIKRLEKRLESVLGRLGSRQDDTIYFEQSGVDALFVDEAHAYKKVPFTTKMDPVKGIDRNPSQRSINLHPKILFVQKNNRGRNVVLATGTPVTNTLAEAWNMTRLVAPQLLEEWNVDTFDKFVSTFAETVESTEINAANQWVSVERLSRFTNGPELIKLIRTAWDVRMGEDLKGLDIPDIKGGKPELVALEITPQQIEITKFLQDVYKQFQALTGKSRRASSWVPVVTMSTGMAAATDPRIVDPRLPDNPNSVVNVAVKRIAEIFHANTEARATQIVFLDRFRPMNTEKLRNFANGTIINVEELGNVEDVDANFNLYDDIRNKLVAAGIPREEIAIANEHDTDAKRLKMQEDMQTGRVRILLGSTAKIGQGINVQDKLIAAHHLDPPIQMTPAQYIQRNGRILRDGNEHSEIEIITYGMKRTLAAGIWQRIETKAKFIVQVLMGKGVGREFEDPADEVTLSIAEQVAELTGDNRILRKVALESEVRQLQQAKEAHYNNVGSARSKVRQYEKSIERHEKTLIPEAKEDKAFLEQNFGEGKPLVLKIGNETFPTAEAFDERFKAITTAAVERAPTYFDEHKSHRSVRYQARGEINGLRLESDIIVYRGSEMTVTTHIGTGATPSIDYTNAKTGKGLIIVAKNLYEKRDERIAKLEEELAIDKAQLEKLRVEAEKTFTQGEELQAKETELSELVRSLSAVETVAESGEGGEITADEGVIGELALAAPEPGSTDDTKRSALISAFAELPPTEKKVMALRVAGKTNDEIAREIKLSPLGVETAYQIAIKKLNRARTTGEVVRSKFRQVMAEKPGERTLGRPELANPAAGPMSRRLVDTVDQLRKEAGVPGVHTDTEVAKEAKQRLDRDYMGERRALFRRAAQGGMFDPVETFMAKRIVAKEALGAVKTNSQARMLSAAKLIDAYRMTGTEQARSFRQRQDFTMLPEERAAEYLSQALLTPDKPRRVRMEALEEPGQREEVLREWMGQVERIKKQLAKLGIDLDAMSEEEVREALKDRVKAVRAVRAVAAAKSDKWDALYEYWISAILSAPPTQVANVTGNTMNATWDFTAQRMAEALVNLAVQDPQSAQLGEFRYIARGIMPGLHRAGKNFMVSWRSEAPVFEEEVTGEEGHTKIETAIGREPAISGTKGRVIRTPLRLLLAVDEFSKSLVGQMQVGAEAYRIALSEKLTGSALESRMSELVDTLGSEAWQAAADKATELAFQKELGRFGKAVINFRENTPGTRYIIPFVQTMSNIFKTGLRKTPLGSIPLLYNLGRQGMVRLNVDKSGWRYTRKQFVPHAAEQLLAWGIYFAIQGLDEPDEDGQPFWTGTVPYQGTKRGERDLAYRTAPPMSIRIGSEWYSYARIEPFATALANMIDMQKTVRQAKNGGDYTAALGKTLTHLVAQVKDKTFARGIGDVLNAIEDGSSAVEWIGNFATSWVPNIVKVAARESDPMIRESKAWGRGDDWTGNLLAALEYKALPLANDVIQPKIDLWGRPIEKGKGISPATDWLFRMVSPIKEQVTGDVLDVDRLITNWNNAHPNEVFAPQPPPPYWEKKIDGKDHTFYMTREEYRQFLEMSGAGARGRIEVQGLNIDNPTQKDLDAIDASFKKSREEARERLWELRLARKAAA